MTPPALDLSHSTHKKIMNTPPRINLRRAASYNKYDRGALSSTSSRFNFNHLLFSPPPSPGLPALIPRPKRSTTEILAARPSRLFRFLFYVAGFLGALYLLAFASRNRHVISEVWPYFSHEEFEMVGQDAVPDFPTPLVVTDGRGRSKWTVSIPPDHDFPLSVDEYSSMSGQCREVSARARDLHHKTPLSEEALLSYDAPDGLFVDVREAEQSGMLPSAGKGIPEKDAGHFIGFDKNAMAGKPVCESTMTFVLESPDAGLGNALMLLWTFHTLAKEQGRSFFIDDSRWAYGDYAGIFQTPAVPDCRPPPRHHMVPCPFQARHLVVSAITAREVFPALLAKNHRIKGKDNGPRDVFELAHAGYKALGTLNKDDQKYVDNRVRHLEGKAKIGDTTSMDAPIVGLHIRRGDQHPLEYQYRESYIPAEVFHGRMQNLVESHYNGSIDSEKLENRAVTVIATDDPIVHKEPDFAGTFPAQERIRLASKDAIQQAKSNENPHVLHHFVDETFGWEGGFFASMFWNLGVERKNNAANAPQGVELRDVNKEAAYLAPPSEQTLKLRNLIGRAYMMDLAVLAGASDKVVCAVSAMGCRLLAVMMGWEDAIEAGNWVNVDGSYTWTGANW